MSSLSCPDNSGNTFNDFEESGLNNSLSLCSRCPYIKNQHIGYNRLPSTKVVNVDKSINDILDSTYMEYTNIRECYKTQIIDISDNNIKFAKTLTLTIIQLLNNNMEFEINQLLSKINKDDYVLWDIMKNTSNEDIDILYIKVLSKYNIF